MVVLVVQALAFLALLFAPLVALAQTAAASLPVDPNAPLAVGDALTELIKLLGTLKGASAIGISLVVVQGVMLTLRTPLADLLGKWKLVVLYTVSCVVAFLAAKAAGATWLASFTAGPLLAAGQNLAHQLYTQFMEKPAVVPGAEK